MENEDIILQLLNDYLKAEMEVKNIGDIRYRTPIDIYEYDKYKLEEFLIIYKIKRLAELGIISEKMATLLRELYDSKIEIEKQIGEEQLFVSNEEENEYKIFLQKLEEKVQLIDITLNKYNLNPDKFDLINIIDMIIKNQKYDKITDEEIVKLIKS